MIPALRSIAVAFATMAALGPLSPRASAQYAAGTVFAVRVASTTSVTIAPYQFNGVTWNVGSALSASLTGTSALTMSSAATSEGALTISSNGKYLGLAGYRTGIQNGGTDRVLGRVDLTTGSFSGPAATIDTTTSIASGTAYKSTGTTAATSGNINSAFWNATGTRYWSAGSGATSSGGTVTHTFGTTTGSVQLHPGSPNTRVVSVFNNQLYASARETGAFGVFTIGTGTPTTAGQVPTLVPGTGSSGSGNPGSAGFVMSPDGKLLYIADERAVASGGGVQKWKLNAAGTQFDLVVIFPTGTVSTVGVRSVAVDFSTTDPTIYAVTADLSNNRILRFQDVLSTQTGLTVIDTSVSTDLFRGVAVIAPVPEPAMLVAVSAFGLGAWRLVRRGRTGRGPVTLGKSAK